MSKSGEDKTATFPQQLRRPCANSPRFLFPDHVVTVANLFGEPSSHQRADEPSPCAWHSKVNRLFNPLSRHAYEVRGSLPCRRLLMEHLFFICFGGARKENSRGSQVGPRGPSLPNVPCCTAANGIKTRTGVAGFNKLSDDRFSNG